MDKLFHSTFDFFSHALPGCCIILALYILDPSIQFADDFFKKANETDIGGGVFLVTLGYVIGFTIYPVGRFLYKLLSKINFIYDQIKPSANISEKYILVREFSPNNFKYIELWNMFCAMAHNLSMACLVLMVCCIKKMKSFSQTPELYSNWRFLAVCSFVAACFLLHRAVIFSIWAANDLDAAVDKLQFHERAARLIKVTTPESNKLN